MKLIPLTQGRFAVVDDEDFLWLAQSNWCYSASGYAVRGEGRDVVTMHVTIAKRHRLWMPDRDIDHKNLCGLDNRIENLRCATHSENLRNRGKQSNNTSGATGVVWSERRSRWIANIKVTGRQIFLGRFKDIHDAIAARARAEVQYFGDFRHNPFDLCPLALSLCPVCNRRLMAMLPTRNTDWDRLTQP